MASAARRRCRCSVLGYLGFSGLLVCPHPFVPISWLGGVIDSLPPSLGSWEAVEAACLA
ncbi:hypothetical protein CABS01_01014 [Colletotrichum abscissum]|uniref:uncharacterized protein n=1 Tax=Colletotrichum abscissum TaxID=1671311 RepID=UPI0027D5D11A|nr:uncharacterized protein CABS01_01014 [Colletotrichum abscissum]KAK1505546.1 hypothetical protein CABS01_01014 [Colletotrichum abscissum]